MNTKRFSFSSAIVRFHFNANFSNLKKLAPPANSVIITDESIYKKHSKKFHDWRTIVIKPGEEYKNQGTVDNIVTKLISIGANRDTTLIGVGGGVITDITGYVAGIYMRGIRCGFVPTSLLAMVDASVGGKNGIDVGIYKNMVGLINQPSFILYDYSFLESLPESEWVNGFAEIIKHACIRDRSMFRFLESHELGDFRRKKALLSRLLMRNVLVKIRLVQEDEFETGPRKILNFGHTVGHAIENSYGLSHGQAVALGMVAACSLSEEFRGFNESRRIRQILTKYGLPTQLKYDVKSTVKIMQSDKKRQDGHIQFILLDKIGRAVIEPVEITEVPAVLLRVVNPPADLDVPRKRGRPRKIAAA